jgi:tetratricopeptide (TPR) repeat protein
MANAMERFFEVSNEMPLNRRLLYALGNTSYLRGNYSAAQGYYNRLLDLLETERVRATTLLPHDRPEHMELTERIMEAQNNLGVTLGTLADRDGNVNYRTRALALFSESARAWDFITRNPTTMVRLFIPGTEIPETNQSLLNTKYTLYPEPGFEPLIYNQIDMDVEDPSIWEYLVPPDNQSRDIPYEIRNQE